MNKGLLTSGAVMLGVAVLVPVLFFTMAGIQGEGGNDMGAFGSVVLGFMFLGVLSPILGITGLVLLIVGAATNGRQQQQQQVVLYTAPPGVPQATRLCNHCRAQVPGGHRFCAACGAPA